jgi:predicted CxxxxCH...CXXCH cytochrome family protein
MTSRWNVRNLLVTLAIAATTWPAAALPAYGSWTAGAALLTVAAAGATTLGDGSNPPPVARVCPGDPATPLDAFTIATGTTPDSIGKVTVTLATGSFPHLASLELTTDAGAPLATVAPAADTIDFTLQAPITLAASATAQYRLRATPRAHTAMPGRSSGGSFNLRGTVTGITSSSTVAGSDAGSAILTIDNRSPASPRWTAVTPGSKQVSLAWQAPADTDVAGTLVLMKQGGPVSDAPTEGVTPGATIGSSTVIYSGAGAATVAGGLTDGAPYYFAVYAKDLCGNYSLAADVGPVDPGSSPLPVGDQLAGSSKPVLAILNPARGAVVSLTPAGTFLVQVRVSSPSAAIGTVQVTSNAGTSWTALARNANYGTLPASGVWQVELPLAIGSYTLYARATNDAGASWVVSAPVGITVKPSRTGDGNLLARDNSSQLCIDCHAISSHASDSTSTTYGSWAVVCRDCHSPHKTTNISLVATEITPPPVGASVPLPRKVVFTNRSGNGAGSFTSPDGSGPCQVCHTQTKYYRADGTGAAHEVTNCASCHKHEQGLRAGCTACHGTKGRASLAGADSLQEAAPPVGADVQAVGAHLAHVNQATWRPTPLPCSECHTMPNTHDNTPGSADVQLTGALARSGGAIPSYDEGTSRCSNTWCHGGKLAGGGGSNTTPIWTSAASAGCGTCHGNPPPVSVNAAQDHPRNTDCVKCHPATSASGSGSTHLDGTVDAPAIDCTACHGDLSTPDGSTNTTAAAAPGFNAAAVDTRGRTSAALPFPATVGAHQAHVNPAASQGFMAAQGCAVCHPLPPNGDVGHANDVIAVAWSSPANAKGVTPTPAAYGSAWESGGASCSNYCHSNGGVLAAPPVTTSLSWTSTANLSCTSCHDTGGAASALSPLHRKHTDAATYKYDCARCHATTGTSSSITGAAQHVNGSKDWKFDAVPLDQSQGTYSGTPGHGCSNTYCHSNGVDRTPPFTSVASPSWNGGTGGCGSCHQAGSAMATGAHAAHVSNAGYTGSFGCVTCHVGTVSSDSAIAGVAGYTKHVNGQADVDATTTYTDATADGIANGSCATTYCHSNGTETLAGTDYEAISWSSTLANDCDGCHGSEASPAFAAVYGEPNYASSTASNDTRNSHRAHVSSTLATAKAQCVDCHEATVNAAGALVLPGAHLDSGVQVTAGAGKKIGTYTATGETCSNISCHGGNSAQWGGPALKCNDCHAGGSDNDSFAFGTAGIISSAEWTSSGHGQSTFGANTFPTTAAGTPCLYCHDGTVTHDASGNPFRLRGSTGVAGAVTGGNYSAAGATSANQVCLNCHAPTANGVDPDGVAANPLLTSTKKISNTHLGSKHGTRNGGTRCWDCHDPHGDGNIKMVGSKVVQTSTDNHGWAATRVTGVVFTANTTGTDYAGASTKVCNACHVTTVYYPASGGNQTHQSGAKCIACHAHDQAGNLAFKEATSCPTCHPTPPTGGRHAAHLATNPSTAYGDLTYRSSSTAYSFGCGKCHGATATNHMTDIGGTVADPYRAGVTFDLGGTYPAVVASIGTENGPTSLVYGWQNGTCSATACHDPQGASYTGKTAVSWSTAATLTCTSCHDGGSNAATTTLPGAHGKHVKATASGGYAYGCEKCHANTVTNATTLATTPGLGKVQHVDGDKNDLKFNASPLDQTVGTFTGSTSGTCSNTYCHSNGVDRTAPFTSGPSAAWNAAAPGCGACHLAGSAMATQAHGAHVNNAAYLGTNFGCVTCHDTVTDDTTISAVKIGQHVNAVVEVPGTSYADGTADGVANGSCGTNYCHSNGTETPDYESIAWNSTLANDCLGCHGAEASPAFTAVYGEPNYTSSTATDDTRNSHRAHVTGTAATAKTQCVDCHESTMNAAGALVAAGTHLNNGVEVTAGAGKKIGTYAAAGETCSNISCHGGNSAQWGGAPLKCSDCHTGGSDTDSFAFGTAGIISSVDWTASGHGQTTFGGNTFPTTAAGTPCLYCHDGAVSHGIAGNPFRLRGVTGASGAITAGNYSAAAATTANQVCLNCHAPAGANGVDPDGAVVTNPLLTSTKKIDTAHGGSKHGGANTGGMRCWDCHDPHGDGNIRMIGSKVVKTATDNHGWAATRLTGITFTANAVGTDYAGASTKICNACHTTTLYYPASGGNQTHQSGAKCVSCHLHEQAGTLAFTEATSCTGCHNTPPTGGRHAAHLVTNPSTAYGDTTIRSSSTQYAFGCGKCHGATAANHMNDVGGTVADPYRAGVTFDLGGTYPAVVASVGTENGPTSLVYGWQNGTCSATACHDPQGASYTGKTAVSWSTAATLTCTSCHDGGSNAAATTLPGAHGKHVKATASGGYAYGCEKCHANTVTNSTTLSTAVGLGKVQHVDGDKNDVKFGSHGTTPQDQSAGTYSGGASGTCANTYCHSNGQDRTSPYVTTSLAWNGAMLADCSSCHGGNASAATKMGPSNDHAAHMDQAAYLGTNLACGRCHAVTVTTGNDRAITGIANHVNGQADVSLVDGGTYGGPATKTCSNVYCHSNGTETPDYVNTNLDWDAGFAKANDCKQCHGSEAGSVAGEPRYANVATADDTRNSHAKHVSSAASCVSCHESTVNGTGTLVSGGTHLDKAVEITTGAGKKIGSYTAAGETCTNIACHGGNSAQWGGASLTCVQCHGTTGVEAEDLGATFWSNSVTATINTTEWTYSGHGKTTGTYDVTANAAAAFSTTVAGTTECLYCHDSAIGHNDAANPFRLRGASLAGGATFNGYSTAAPNAPCLNCHDASDNGVDPDAGGAAALRNGATLGDAAHDGVKHTLGTQGGKFCWDCHDPHGDRISTGGNIAMIRANVNRVTDGTYGYLGASGVQAAVTFTTEAAGGAASGRAVELTTTAGSNHLGVCQACHDPTSPAPSPATAWTKYWNRLGYDDPDGAGGTAPANSTHNAISATTPYCVSCHAHKDKFAGSGSCSSCHLATAAAGNQDLDDYVYGNAIKAMIDRDDWAATGHGATASFSESGNPAPNFPVTGTVEGCLYCHAPDAAIAGGNSDTSVHNDAADPFRLTNTAGADGKNGVCLVCHKPGSAGFDPDGANTVFASKNRTTGPAISATHFGLDHAATGGGIFCWDCHDPHGDQSYGATTTILAKMIQERPTQASSGSTGWGVPTTQAPRVAFRKATGTSATAFDWGDYVATATTTDTTSSSTYRGVCQVCHTSASTAYFRQTLFTAGHNNSGNPACTSCHKHQQPPTDAFKGGGCIGCHGTVAQDEAAVTGSRRAVAADFSKRSHHVGNGGAAMGGTLTDNDCVVCHGEGSVTVQGGTPSETASGLHKNGVVDLRDADSSTGGYFQYNVNAIKALTPATASSANATWKQEMSGRSDDLVGAATVACSPTGTGCSKGLDRFCISCHDADGASQGYKSGDAAASALNPFADTKITNDYDQATRCAEPGNGASSACVTTGGTAATQTRVVDVASRVHETARTAAGGSASSTDRDIAPLPASGIAGDTRVGDGRKDPPEGVFSRHAIRGLSASVYGATNASWDTATYWTTITTWKSNSVMGCADCHTTDGVNGANGNAHGSATEYLLKNANGTASAIATTPSTYVCARCHNASAYIAGTHTANGGDFQDYSGQNGTARVPAGNTGGNVYGYACGNCHGGGASSKAGAAFPTGSTGAGGFGTIHGTSQVLGIQTATGTARHAYRFTNGNSMRYFDPVNWTSASTRSCYTLASGSTDTWGACTKHSSGGGLSPTTAQQRPLKY